MPENFTKKQCSPKLDISLVRKTGKHLLRNQKVSDKKESHLFFPGSKFSPVTNVAGAPKRGNI